MRSGGNQTVCHPPSAGARSRKGVGSTNNTIAWESMTFLWRIWAAVMLVNLTVLVVFVGLAALQFGNISSTLVGERLVVLAARTAAPFESAVKLGLPLSAVRNADALLERARQTDDAIVAIHVFDADGLIIRSTGTPMPAAIPAAALLARAQSNGDAWHRESKDGFLSSVDIRFRDGRTAGGILIVYPGGANVTRVRAMAAELEMNAIAIWLVAAVLSAALLRVGLGSQIKLSEDIDRAIIGFEQNAWRSAAGRPPTETESDGHEIHSLLVAAEDRYRAEGQALRAGRGDPA